MALTEFGLIDKYFRGIGAPPQAGIALGIGDDCALLDSMPGQQLALSVDTLVAGVHFPAGADPYLIGQRALRVNLSDLAAMGAQPLAFTLAITLPDADESWLSGFSRGLDDAARAFGISLIGGNTSSGPRHIINIQILGQVPSGQALLRSGARPGDVIVVSGTLGDARAALDHLAPAPAQRDARQDYLLDRYYRPEPRIGLGAALRGIASAAIDISDGLSADLGHILERSEVGAVIDLPALPLSFALQGRAEAPAFALSGGDDYELCFTVPPARLNKATALAARLGIPVTAIGTITEQRRLLARSADGHINPLAQTGYRHF